MTRFPSARSDTGSLSLELVVLAPAILAIFALVIAGGRAVVASQAVAQAASQAARDASLQSSPSAGVAAARTRAASVLDGQGLACRAAHGLHERNCSREAGRPVRHGDGERGVHGLVVGSWSSLFQKPDPHCHGNRADRHVDRAMSAGRLPSLAGGDRGSVSLLFVVVAVGLLACVGLVVDGGGKARAAAEADDVARAAARAGVQAINATGVLAGNEPRTNPTRAAAAARTYLEASGTTGTVTVAPGGRQLTVNTRDTYTPVFLTAIGLGPMRVTGSATADLVTVEGGTP